MGPIVVLRGTQTAKDYYTHLLAELEANVREAKGFYHKQPPAFLGRDAYLGKTQNAK